MSTRVVVWNVNRFSINTVNDSSGGTFLEQLDSISQSALNHWFIENIARATDGNGNSADILVVIEVQSSRSVLGSLVGASGAQGVLFLLNSLRENVAADWCVVPPLKLVGLNDAGEAANYTEGIAVYFRSTKLNFTGPYIWPTIGNVALPPALGIAGPYPAPYANALPANNYFAGQYEFFQNPANRTGDFNYISGNYRRPFLTTFTEVVGGRVIKLMSVHPSPNSSKVQVVNSISDIVEIQPSVNPQVVMVAGDFNLNTITTYNFFTGKSTGGDANQGYYGLRQIFNQRISSTNRDTNGVTAIYRIGDATPAAYLTRNGIDNIFLRYDGGLAAPVPNNPRIINPVTGTDEYNLEMMQSIATINSSYMTTVARENAFRKDVNYGHIAHFAGVSDHLPLVIDI